MEVVDIRNATFEEFVDFIFDHAVKRGKPWHWTNLEVQYDPARNAEYLIKLFSDPYFLFDRYSRDQLEQGFWVIPGGSLDGSVQEIIWDDSLPFEQRERCIRSMFTLFRDFFAVDSLETSCCMWWDSLCYGYCCGNLVRERSDEERKIQDVMFETLSQILQLNSPSCQEAALHGLGHLRHPDTEHLIRSWLTEHPRLSKEFVEYAEACITGEIM